MFKKKQKLPEELRNQVSRRGRQALSGVGLVEEQIRASALRPDFRYRFRSARGGCRNDSFLRTEGLRLTDFS